jgi:hypothetical protein
LWWICINSIRGSEARWGHRKCPFRPRIAATCSRYQVKIGKSILCIVQKGTKSGCAAA